MSNRHPSTEHMLRMFGRQSPTVKDNYAAEVSQRIKDLVEDTITMLPDSPELTAGLRKLLEARDCFVRAYFDEVTVDYRDR